MTPTRQGRVASFDEAAGYGRVAEGTVSGDSGVWFFHCTAIADGTRTIDVDAAVEFQLVAGRLGRWEADALRPTTGVVA